VSARWTPTGTSVSGLTYGYDILARGEHHAVLLRLGSFFRPIAVTVVPCRSYDHAVDTGRRFVYPIQRWQHVVEHDRILASGMAVIGGVPTFLVALYWQGRPVLTRRVHAMSPEEALTCIEREGHDYESAIVSDRHGNEIATFPQSSNDKETA
jgi:hypothetical protein